MTSLYGTSYFTSHWAACGYYRDYCETAKDARAMVAEKLEAGEIHIGAPGPLKIGERMTLVDGGRSYAVVVED